ncbi:MAG TPA: LysM peptidoglycan-binding domain-containing protein, partial [Bacteroidia bacterium]|nr:LysM peptidoglycan-binding domain-containing protein [Bacteroidia bacterium]
MVFVTLVLAASTAEAGLRLPGDSLRVKWMDGKKYILHKVETKETWSSLSRRYNVTIDDIKLANTGIDDLKVGQIIHVPVLPEGQSTTEPVTTPAPQPAQRQPVFYTVKHGETLYSVSKRFNKTVDEMRDLNHLDSDQLREGQQLVVRYLDQSAETTAAATATSPSPAPAEKAAASEGNQTAKSDEMATMPATLFEKPTKTVEPIRKASGGKTLVQVTETGIASWIQDGEVNQNKYYGLHRTAPIGTIIKVTNRMNNQSVYVKIVGVLPDTGDNDNVIIKVSQAVAGK